MMAEPIDSGQTWSCDTPFFDVVVQWLCVASSATGNRLLAGGMITPNQSSPLAVAAYSQLKVGQKATL